MKQRTEQNVIAWLIKNGEEKRSQTGVPEKRQ
jgi:hypothetical protein